jgi:hypothetical protein
MAIATEDLALFMLIARAMDDPTVREAAVRAQ